MTRSKSGEHQSYWLWVMCLTGVDYFSTLGYQPSIAFEAVGILAPLATVVLVAVTLFCALPIYCYVAVKSPHGLGSIGMLEKLLHGWSGKLVVLALLGFAATDFIITKTLSAADAAEHLIHNAYWQETPEWMHGQMMIAMLMLVLLGAAFLRGFREVIPVAIVIVALYLVMNLIVLGSGVAYLLSHTQEIRSWFDAVVNGQWEFGNRQPRSGGWLSIIGVCLFYFPRLALGLSGFETGVAIMSLVRGDASDDPQHPIGRIRNTRKLLFTAAAIMSLLLLASAFVTSTLIDPNELRSGGAAENRALAYLAHGETAETLNPIFGTWFGTLYDISTIAILWFAGASAMSGLLHLIPRYLPRYGMAPRWSEMLQPLVVLFTIVSLGVTWIFDANVSAQGGAYATGVMALMTSACVAVVVDRWQSRKSVANSSHRWVSYLQRVPWFAVLITIIFIYTTLAIVIEKPDGIKIAGVFILTIVVVSAISRARRSTELRFERFEFPNENSRLLWDTLRHLEFPVLVPHRPGHQNVLAKEKQIRQTHRLGPEVPIVFVEAQLGDVSEFEQSPLMEIVEQEGLFVIRLTRCVSIAHVLASVALELSKVGKPPELHFGWSDESTLSANLKFVLFGEGNVPWLVRELLVKGEADENRRPRVFIG